MMVAIMRPCGVVRSKARPVIAMTETRCVSSAFSVCSRSSVLRPQRDNRLEDQEATMLALHLLQNCMVYVNTLMVQRVLGEPIWLKHMGVTEQRALTPLFWGHVNPYGTFRLDMTARLPLDLPTPDAAPDQFLLQGV